MNQGMIEIMKLLVQLLISEKVSDGIKEEAHVELTRLFVLVREESEIAKGNLTKYKLEQSGIIT